MRTRKEIEDSVKNDDRGYNYQTIAAILEVLLDIRTLLVNKEIDWNREE